MSEIYISDKYLEKTTNYLLNIDFSSKAATSLTLFLLFKATDTSQTNDVSLNGQEQYLKFSNAVNLLMSFYAPWENLSEKYSLLYPFYLKWKGGQSGSIGNRDRWVKPSNVYNLFRNAKDEKFGWITEMKKESDTSYRFSFNYLEKLIEYCNINETKKIEISFLAAWALKYLNLNNSINLDNSPLINTKILINVFYKLFNITDDEKDKLFLFNKLNLAEFSEKKPDIEKNLREKVGYMDKPEAKKKIAKKIRVDIPINHSVKRSFTKTGFKNPTFDYIKDLLITSRQIILYGPLGTGKTTFAEELKKSFDDCMFIQFHQTYGYEEFIGALIPEGGNLRPKQGMLTEFIKNKVTSNSDKKYLLIIDEINRGNISKIFGEVIAALDRDRSPITLSYNPNETLKLPLNLYIIGTMNSVDRSIALLDYALRRRFEFVYLEPDSELLDSVTDDSSEDLEGISINDVFNKINKKLNDNLGKDYCMGHTFFMPKRIENEKGEFIWNLKELERIFNHMILPLVEEYCFDNEALLISIVGEDLKDRLIGYSFKNAFKKFLGI